MFPRIRKRSSLYGFDSKENPEKGLRQWKKVSMRRKRNLCVCVCERDRQREKKTTTTIFKVYKKCKSPIQKGF